MAEPVTIEFEFRNKRFESASAGLKAFSKALEATPLTAGAALSKELKTYLTGVAEALARRHGNGYPGGTSANSLSKRSGKLVESIRNSIRTKGTTLNDIEGSIGGTFYARIHETGGIIKPKKAKFLAIPLPAALKGNGTPIHASPRDWKNTFVITSKAGNKLIVQRQGKEIVPLYVLKSSVKIPPRLKMRDTLQAGLPYFVDKAVDAVFNAILK
jgi:hypothetical protein